MIEHFEEIIGYVFNDKKLIREALTHSSYANENKNKTMEFNERMEFLGDSVLSLVISEYIFKNLPNLPEGELTKIRARIVCETSLADVAGEIELGKYIMLGRGEELTGGRNRSSILADGFEAVLASIFLDSNFETVKKFILRIMNDKIEEGVSGEILIDYKTKLQEIVQAKTKNKLSYAIYNEEGPDHNKTFFIEVFLKDEVLGRGKGNNKKEAEQQAAKEAIKKGNF